MKHSSKKLSVGDYVKKDGWGISRIWNVDDSGKIQLQDLFGNKEKKLYSPKGWYKIEKPAEKPFEIYKGWIIEDDFHPIMEEVAFTAYKGDKGIDSDNDTDEPIIVAKDKRGYWLTKSYLKQAIDNLDNPKSNVKPTTSESRSKSGAKGFMATRLKMAERGDFKDYTPIEVLFEAQKFQSARTKSGAARDEMSDSKKRLSPTPENLVRWMKEPGKFDLIGVDTFKKNDPTADLKIRKEIFWSRLLKK